MVSFTRAVLYMTPVAVLTVMSKQSGAGAAVGSTMQSAGQVAIAGVILVAVLGFSYYTTT